MYRLKIMPCKCLLKNKKVIIFQKLMNILKFLKACSAVHVFAAPIGPLTEQEAIYTL
jgi:hypothetical protein